MQGKKLSLGSIVVLAIFALTPLLTSTCAAAQKEKVLHNFNQAVGGGPLASLTSDSAGNLYGTTLDGGAYKQGTVFELMPKAGGGWAYKILHTFRYTSTDHRDGYNPASRLVFDGFGNLYGTTTIGGTDGNGVLYRLSPNADGTWAETVLLASGLENPIFDLAFDPAGNLYSEAGNCNYCGGGGVIEMSPGSSGWTVKIQHVFQDNGTDGWNPSGGLVMDAAGNLYGTTASGGTSCDLNCGVIFKLIPRKDGIWAEEIVHNFPSDSSDGSYPLHLVVGPHGSLYGTANDGGNSCPNLGCGIVYELSPQPGGQWTEKILYAFSGPDGAKPDGLTIVSNKIYGTTNVGGGGSCYGGQGCGVVFELSRDSQGQWQETVLHSFDLADGEGPIGDPIVNLAGDVFGATGYGGFYNGGTVFEITK
ncbi:MAG TPA: choice-of-anchor tandem repeat GloVer-containing protein [Candidatus Sulfotelmatobacter sp.]|nr:choice-of-anchor tandem repeat GloVer-containing protein [Candidatus Sulfotelmatobacter sp.]